MVIQYRQAAALEPQMAYFSYPSLIRRIRSLSSLWSSTVKLSVRKLESWGYSVVKIA